MNTAKECKPVIMTTSTRDLYGSGKLYYSDSFEEMEYLSQLKMDSKNLVFPPSNDRFIDQNIITTYYAIGNILKAKRSVEFFKSYTLGYFLENEKVIKDLRLKKPETKISPNEIQLTDLFIKELNEFNCENNTSKENIKSVFDSIVRHIARLNYIHANVFINNSNKIKVSLYFDNDRVLMINKSFDLINKINNDSLVTYSLFADKELLVSDIVEISTLINGFKSYLEA